MRRPASPWRGRAIYGALFIASMTTSALVTAAAQHPDRLHTVRMLAADLTGGALGEEVPSAAPEDKAAASSGQDDAPATDAHPDEPEARLLAAALSEPERQARPKAPRAKEAQALLAVAAEMGMSSDALTNPCTAWIDSTCTARALDPFFASLDRAASGEGRSRVTVFGNSLIVRDRITDVWRDRLQARFGNAGQGFLLVDRMTPYGPRKRTASYARNFVSYNTVWGKRGPWPHAIAGSLNTSTDKALSLFPVRGEVAGQLFWLDHKTAPAMELTVDGAPVLALKPTGRRQGRVSAFSLPPGAKELKLRADAEDAVLYGLSLEKQAPGVILDTLAVVGSDPTHFMRGKAELVAPQLEALEPDLVTLLLGGNEVKRVAWGGSTLPKVRRDLHRFIDRVQAAAPGAACLVVGPLENVVGTYRGGNGSWEPRWQTFAVNRIMKEVAAEEGCAYFELFEAMGGVGALKKLQAHDMLHEDMIHPRGQGLDLVGELINDALLTAYESAPRPIDEDRLARLRRPLTQLEGKSALAAWERLRAAERTERRPLRVFVGELDGSVDDQLVTLLADRLHRVGDGLREAPAGALNVPREATVLEVYWRGEPPGVVDSRGNVLEGATRTVHKASNPADNVFVTTFAIEGVRSPRLDAPALAWAARRRYAGAIIDRPVDAGAAVLADRGYAVAVIGEGQTPPPAAACLALTSAPPAGCVGLDAVALTGGPAQWQGRSLLTANGALTADGEAIVVRLVMAMLMEPPRPTTLSAVVSGRDTQTR